MYLLILGRRSTQQPNEFQPDNKRKHFADNKSDINQMSAYSGSAATSNLFAGLKYNNFILYLHGGRNCLQMSAQRSKVTYSEKEVAGEKNDRYDMNKCSSRSGML